MKLINEYYASQKIRVAIGNRIAQTYIHYLREHPEISIQGFPKKIQKLVLENKKSDSEKPDKEKVMKPLDFQKLFMDFKIDWQPIELKYYNKYLDIEKEMKKDFKLFVKDFRIWNEWLIKVKGIGEGLATILIQNIDIHRAKYRSSLYSYCGLAVDTETNKAVRLKAGVKINYNPLMKKTCFLIGESFIKSSSPYKQFYDECKKRELDRVTKNHAHIRARRYMVKQFLSDLWEVWRTQEGLPTPPPYIVDKDPVHHQRKVLV